MKDQINFLPINKSKKNKRKTFFKNGEILLIIFFSVLFILIYSGLTILNGQCIAEIKKTDERIINESDFQIPYENLILENQVIVFRNQVVEQIQKKQTIPMDILIGVQESIPLEVIIIEYQFNERTVQLNGKTKNQEAIIAFRNNLIQTGRFDDLTIKKIEKIRSIQETNENKESERDKMEYWDFVFKIMCKGEK
jgi:hypothetical protein